jgi:hypothetical protein
MNIEIRMPEGDVSWKWAWGEEHRSRSEPECRFSHVPPHHQLNDPFPETFQLRLFDEVSSYLSKEEQS